MAEPIYLDELAASREMERCGIPRDRQPKMHGRYRAMTERGKTIDDLRDLMADVPDVMQAYDALMKDTA
jgi:hypothetical protein